MMSVLDTDEQKDGIGSQVEVTSDSPKTTYLVKAFICARQEAMKVVTVLRRSYPCGP